MKKALSAALAELRVGEPLFVRNLTVFPLFDGGKDDAVPAVFPQALEEGAVSVGELEAPFVEEVSVENHGNDPLFLLDGEEIFGGMQARVTTTAALVQAGDRVNVPVACVEQGRWSGERVFEGSFSLAHPRLRSILCRGVSASLRSKQSFRAPQREVWKEITRELESFKVQSATSSFHDLATTLSSQTQRYSLDRDHIFPAQGMVITAGRDVLGMEYASGPELLAKLAPRMLGGYGLEALERRRGGEPPSQEKISRLLERVGSLEASSYPGVSLGQDVRYEDKSWAGRALGVDEGILQASFFPVKN